MKNITLPEFMGQKAIFIILVSVPVLLVIGVFLFLVQSKELPVNEQEVIQEVGSTGQEVENGEDKVTNVIPDQQIPIAQRCEFPTEIAGLAGGEEDVSNFGVEVDNPDGITVLRYATYSNLTKDVLLQIAEDQNSVALNRIVLANVSMFKFKDRDSATTLYVNGPRDREDLSFSSCAFAGVSGMCAFDILSLSLGRGSASTPYTMVWLEENMIKSVEVGGMQQSNENVNDADKRLREIIETFVSTFKNCEV